MSDFPALLRQYKSNSATQGYSVTPSGGADVSGMAVDISDDGELIVLDDEDNLHHLHTGDVSIRGVMGYVQR